MPMVETSVAVATALDHRGADHERQRQRGQGDDEGADDLAAAGSLDVAEILAAIAPPHQRRQRDRQHHARQQAAGEQRRNRDAGHRADGDQHQARRDGLGLRAGGREQGDEIAGLGAARLHFRKQHRRHRRHIGGLRARNARNQIHRADQHVMQSAADMAEQAGQKRHHGARHAGHLDQQVPGTRTAAPTAGSGGSCPRPSGRPAPSAAYAWSARDIRRSPVRTRRRSARRRRRRSRPRRRRR